MELKRLVLAAGMIVPAPFVFVDNGKFPSGPLFQRRKTWELLWVISAILIILLLPSVSHADNGTQFGVDDDLTVWGVDGSTSDADVEIKGFTVFGSTDVNNKAVYSGKGSVFVGGALEVSSGTYLWDKVGIGTSAPSSKLDVRGDVGIVWWRRTWEKV